MASTRAARIASWMLRIRTMDGDPRQAMVELWPRLQALATEPVRTEDDYVERSAFQAIAFEANSWSGSPAQSPTTSLRDGVTISLCSFVKTAGPASG
jgi:hypothetical protein